ncbi:MAG: hypothetical protein KDB18_13560, partial [Salinibacterium sp.]|nr:hypothetical protein [Salinibacterium sp.]
MLGGVVASIMLGAQGWWIAGVGTVVGLAAMLVCFERWRALSLRIGRVGDEAAKLGRSLRSQGLSPIGIDT